MNRKIIFVMTAAAIASMAMTTSCKKDKKDPVITITTQPAATVGIALGGTERLTVAATATEGAALTWQWHSNATASNTSGMEIGGATTANYDLPATLREGTYYYFCEARAQGAVSQRTDVATVTVAGVSIGGVVWATRNVGAPGAFAANPQDAGMLYQWDSKIGYLNTGTVASWNTTESAATSWQAANDPSPDGWRVPTVAELEALKAAPSEWTIVGGAYGRRIGTGANTIFIPAAGTRYFSTGALENVGERGTVWSNEQFSVNMDMAISMDFTSSLSPSTTGARKTFARTIRCVKR